MESSEEEKDLEFRSRRIVRSEILIAQFSGGYAAGWSFAVPEAFKEALDIRLTPKVFRKVTRQVYTQGQSFSFKQGDVLHNSRIAYEDFSRFLQGNNPVSLKVVEASQSGYETRNTYQVSVSPTRFQKIGKKSVSHGEASSFRVLEQVFEPGEMGVVEYRPNPEKTALVEIRKFKINQDQFIVLLQTGSFFDQESEMRIDFGYEGAGNGEA